MALAVGSTSHDLSEPFDTDLEITGDLSETTVDDELLVPALRDAIQRTLGSARSLFSVRIEPHGDAGEILVRVIGRHASLQLSFERDEADPGYVAGIVRDAVERFDL